MTLLVLPLALLLVAAQASPAVEIVHPLAKDNVIQSQGSIQIPGQSGGLRKLQQTCSEQVADYLEGLLVENQNLETQGLTMECSCTDEGENYISCVIDRGEDCSTNNCGTGWTCLDPEAETVEVCNVITETQIWTTTPDGSFSRLFVRDKRECVSGVSNIQVREVDIDRSTGECTYYVDNEACTSCEICPSGSVVVADCDNVVPGASAECGDVIGLLFKLLLLGAAPSADVEVVDTDSGSFFQSLTEIDLGVMESTTMAATTMGPTDASSMVETAWPSDGASATMSPSEGVM